MRRIFASIFLSAVLLGLVFPLVGLQPAGLGALHLLDRTVREGVDAAVLFDRLGLKSGKKTAKTTAKRTTSSKKTTSRGVSLDSRKARAIEPEAPRGRRVIFRRSASRRASSTSAWVGPGRGVACWG